MRIVVLIAFFGPTAILALIIGTRLEQTGEVAVANFHSAGARTGVDWLAACRDVKHG